MGEYISDEFENYLTINSIEHQLNVPYYSTQNGVAEQKKQHGRRNGRDHAFRRKFAEAVLGQAIKTGKNLTNRLPMKANNNKILFELWNNRKPNLPR